MDQSFATSKPFRWVWRSISKETNIPFLFLFLFLLYVFPLAIMGEDSYITIHDNLDGVVANQVLLARPDSLFNVSSNEIIPQIMGGIPRNYLVSEQNLIFLLFFIFPPFTAYLVNHILVHLVAFLGMALLLKQSFTSWDSGNGLIKTLMIWGTALAFGILPFYTMYGLTVAGQPLLLYAFLNFLYRKETVPDALIIFLFPFYANFLLIGIFIVPALFVVLLVFWKRNGRNIKALFVLAAFSILFMSTEYNFLLANLLNPQYVSHRSDWDFAYMSFSIQGVWKNTFDMFLHGQYHAPSYQELIIPVTVIAGVISLFRTRKMFLLCFILVITQWLISVLYGFYFWDALIPLKEKVEFISSFNLGRAHWLSPFIWYVIFFLALDILQSQFQKRKVLQWVFISTILFAQLAYNLSFNSYVLQYVNHFMPLPGFHNNEITYRQFYAENLFGRIKNYIGQEQEDYRVVSIGIHPSIALYNGFYTLDSYQSNYPLSYKQKFRQVIAPELAKSDSWRNYFDSWGSRCYIFVSEVNSFLVRKEANMVIQALDLDMQALKALGGRYIFSALEIKNYQEEALRLLGTFDDPDSAWKIYLYEVN